MTWTVVAKKDFEDAVRAKTLWVLIALFTLVIAGASYVFGSGFLGTENPSANSLLVSLLLPTALILPALGIAAGYKSIVGERASGSIKLLLSLPHRRRDVLLGKFVGRSAVVGVSAVVAFLVGGVVFAVMARNFAAVEYFGMLALTLVLSTAFVSVAVGFSASTKSDTAVLVIGIALVLLFTLLWDLLLLLMAFLLTQPLGMANDTVGDFMGFLSALNPRNAYNRLAREWFLNTSGGGMTGTQEFYTEPWFAVVVLAAWIVVPLGIGYWRFENAEL